MESHALNILLPESLTKLPLQSFKQGEIIIQEGSEEGVLYFLERGTVEVVKEGQSITRVRERGAMFGEMSVLLHCRHTAAVTAVTDVECRVAEHPAEYFAEHPEVVLYVCWILARRLDSLNRYLVDIKSQYQDREDHVGMVNDVLGALMSRHPRNIAPQPNPGP